MAWNTLQQSKGTKYGYRNRWINLGRLDAERKPDKRLDFPLVTEIRIVVGVGDERNGTFLGPSG